MKTARFLFKAISWRIVATLITGTIAFFLTGSLALAGGIAGIDSGLKIVAYIVHEWAWERKRK